MYAGWDQTEGIPSGPYPGTARRPIGFALWMDLTWGQWERSLSRVAAALGQAPVR